MKLSIRETVIFGMLGGIMYVSKLIMEAAPNIHLLGVFIIAFTVVYRKKALYPLYTYVLINGIFGGFGAWWIPYLYVWTVLWAVVMLLPRNIPKGIKIPLYMVVNACHGFMFGLSVKGMIAWIVAGFPFDFIHGVSNFFSGILIVPIISLLLRLERESV